MTGSRHEGAAVSASIPMVRAVGLGLGAEAIEGMARDAIAGTRARREAHDRPHDTTVRSVARALGWRGDAMPVRGPWDGDESTFVAYHDGSWDCSSLAWLSPALADHTIATYLGLRVMHWPAMQRAHTRCWVFAGPRSDQTEAERLALREATLFADALTVPDGALSEAIARHQGDVEAVVRSLDGHGAAVRRRIDRLVGRGTLSRVA